MSVLDPTRCVIEGHDFGIPEAVLEHCSRCHEENPARIPGNIEESLQRQLDGGGLIEFETAPAGWLTPDGKVRKQDYRAYYWTPVLECAACENGRVPSLNRPGGTIKCKACNGTGETKRTRMTSVSTILDNILPMGGLPIWAERMGVEGLYRAIQQGLISLTVTPEQAYQRLRELAMGMEGARDEAAGRGLRLHDLLRDYMETGLAPKSDGVPEDQMGYYRALVKFLLREKVEPEQVEELVCDPAAGYAGRSDLVARNKEGLRARFDYKSSEEAQVYTQTHVQVPLYERGGRACGDDPCDALFVVVLDAAGEYELVPVHGTERTVERALTWLEEIRPINTAVESRNRARKEARRAG